uniref:Uncharacterized protein n=1 Tax=Arundo donax TaxID=35708 RepID=A0A0A9B4L5_ARUDO
MVIVRELEVHCNFRTLPESL